MKLMCPCSAIPTKMEADKTNMMKQTHWTKHYHQIIISGLVVMAVLLVVCTVFLVVLLTGRGNASPGYDGETALQSEEAQSSWVPPKDLSQVVLPETPDAGMAYQDRIVFVGDTTTAHLVTRGGLTGGRLTRQVWATESKDLLLDAQITSAKIVLPSSKESMTVAEAAGREKPAIMVITLGVKWGVPHLCEQDFKGYYADLVYAIQKASPKTTIILQSIFPIALKGETESLTNQKIDICNGWVKEVAYDCGCLYLDTQSVLKGMDNALLEAYAYDSGGINLTQEAYEVILTYIRTHAYMP